MTNQSTTRLSKAESARINGAKSSGPVTPQGKANAANGNLRHGAYSTRLVMDGENLESYEKMKLTFFLHFQPEGPFEAECVESMVTARWRIRRLESAETSQLNHALLDNKAANGERFENLDPRHERGIAVESKIGTLDTLTRVQDRLHRIYERNFKLLANSRRKSGRPLPQQVPCPAEPATAQCEPEVPQELTNQPTEMQSGKTPASAMITKAALFLIIFAILLLAPVTARAKSQPNAAIIAAAPAHPTHKGGKQ